MPVGSGFCCRLHTFYNVAQLELQTLKEADFCQDPVATRDFEQLSPCFLLSYLLLSLLTFKCQLQERN